MNPKKSIWGFLIICIILLILVFQVFALQTEPSKQDTTKNKTIQSASTSEKNVKSLRDITSFWELTELGGVFRWFIFLTLILGLGLSIFELVRIYTDRIKSRELLKTNLRDISTDKLKLILQQNKGSSISEIGNKLFDYIEKMGTTIDSNEEIMNFLKRKEQKFNSYTTAVNFLSDTAGAFGLLGTVWGMFVTFFSETWDTTTILRGMGIALVTTLLGLIVSIILNFSSTSVFRLFIKYLNLITDKAEDLRFALIAGTGVKQEMESKRRLKKSRLNSVFIAPEEPIVGEAGKSLLEPIRIKVLDENQLPLEDKQIEFEVISLNSNEDSIKGMVTTDSKGEVTINFNNPTQIGKYIFRCCIKGEENKQIEKELIVKAVAPEKIKILSKQYLSVPLNEVLDEPLRVKVLDKYENPVSGQVIVFETSDGEFVENHKKNLHQETNSQGVATAQFLAGANPGLCKVTAKINEMNENEVSFNIMIIEK